MFFAVYELGKRYLTDGRQACLDRGMNAIRVFLIFHTICRVFVSDGFAETWDCLIEGNTTYVAPWQSKEFNASEEYQRLRNEITRIDYKIFNIRETIKKNPAFASVLQSELTKLEKERTELSENWIHFDLQTHVRNATFYADLFWVGEKTTLYYSQNKIRPYSGWVRATYRTGEEGQTEARIRKLSYYEKGRPQTTFVWKPNGERCLETTLRNGNGVENHWHANGMKRERSTYRDGLANGECMLWYPSGKLEEKGNYKDGNLHGLVMHYDERGKILGKATWKDGEPVEGTIVRWLGQAGKIRHSYKNGKRDGEWIAWDSKGRKRASGEFKKGKRSGLWIEFDEEGKEISSRPFPETKP